MKHLRINLLKVFALLCEDLKLDGKTSEYLLVRARKEGFYFLSVVLPKFSKHVLSCLEQGRYVPFRGFPRGKTILCEYFSKWLNRLFDLRSGYVRVKPSYVYLRKLRQLCEYFDKFSTDISESLILESGYNYHKGEQAIKLFDRDIHQYDTFHQQVRKNFLTFYSLSRASIYDALQKCRPRYGPGTFAEWDLVDKEKFLSPSHYKDSIPKLVPRELAAFSGYFKHYPSVARRCNKNASPILADVVRRCRVLFVPKNTTKCRSISQEPLALLPIQMSYFAFATETLNKDSFGRINFTNQEINRELAREGSLPDGEWATLDLSSASDSVSFKLCNKLFFDSPFMRFFLSQRSSTYHIPSLRMYENETARNGGSFSRTPVRLGGPFTNPRYELRKLAGMGSGLTFPTMALLIHVTLSTALQMQTKKSFKWAMRNVYVFGDDIIIPKWFYQSAIDHLKKVGFAVNRSKSFHKGNFRESCGGDYFLGKDVCPTRLTLRGAAIDSVPRDYRVTLGSPFRKAGQSAFNISVASLEAHCRQLMPNTRTKVKDYIYERLETSLQTQLFHTHPDTPFIGKADAYMQTPAEQERDYDFSYPPQGDEDPVVQVYSRIPVTCSKLQIPTSPYAYLNRFFSSERMSISDSLMPSYGEITLPYDLGLKGEKQRVSVLSVPTVKLPWLASGKYRGLCNI